MENKIILPTNITTEWLSKYALQLAVLLMLSGTLYSYFYLSHTADTLTQQNAKINAERYLAALTAYRTLNTKEEINTLKLQNITISHDYKNIKNVLNIFCRSC